MDPLTMRAIPRWLGPVFLSLLTNDIVKYFMTHEKIKNLLLSDEEFDVCLIENFAVDALLV
jgi:hypothetical protein